MILRFEALHALVGSQGPREQGETVIELQQALEDAEAARAAAAAEACSLARQLEDAQAALAEARADAHRSVGHSYSWQTLCSPEEQRRIPQQNRYHVTTLCSRNSGLIAVLHK